MIKFTLCADDFGLGGAVDHGILQLVAENRLNAVSCMVMGKTFGANAKNLQQMAKNAQLPLQIGLHLTFTEYAPVGEMKNLAPQRQLPTISTLISKAYTGKLDKVEIKQQIERQLSVFVDTFDRTPDFIDGHQHAHVLPIIREALVDLILSKAVADIRIRSCHLPFTKIMAMRISTKRSLIIANLSKRFKVMLDQNAIQTNSAFYGINEFSQHQDYSKMMQTWLGSISSNHESALVMCHPGIETDTCDINLYDPIAKRRPDELAYLSSMQFLEDMKANGLSLGTLSE